MARAIRHALSAEPQFSENALWFAFAAPADGVYERDTKRTTETSADIALFASCGGAATLRSDTRAGAPSCRDGARGAGESARVSTHAFVRNPLFVRVHGSE